MKVSLIELLKLIGSPGSAFKLFVYLAALEKGYEPDDIIIDKKINIDGWRPKNWNNIYLGEVTLREAFAKSINTVAVDLAGKVGIGNIVDLAHRLGISSSINRDLSSSLGTSEVNLLELTGAYAHVASEGKSVWPHGIEEILSAEGEVIYKRSDSGKNKIISDRVVKKMNDMLVEVVESGTGKNAKLDWVVAGKTGTSQKSRDAWFVGYSGDILLEFGLEMMITLLWGGLVVVEYLLLYGKIL